MEQSFEQKVDEWSHNLEVSITGFISKLGIGYIFEAILAIFFTTVWLLLINVLWDDLGFLKNDFKEILKIINITGLTTIALYYGLLLIRTKVTRTIIEIITNIFSIYIMYKLVQIYPFDFGGSFEFLNNWAEYILWILISLTLLSTVGEFAKLIKTDKVN